MDKQCKGLIIQNNPFSYLTGNGKTIASMFSEWDSNCLAQIYTSNLEPDFSICKEFFKMSDVAAFKSFVSRKEYGHEIINEKTVNSIQSNVIQSKEAILTKLMKGLMSNSSFFVVIRDYVWKKSKWKNKKLCEWLDKVRPQFVFLSAGNISAFYDMALFICKRYNIPLFVHIGDDYFIYCKSLNPWKNLQRKRMSIKLKQVIEKSQYVIAICDKMASVFKEKYGGKYFVCMNSVEIEEPCNHAKEIRQDRQKLVYAGNLGINRWKVLRLIGEALEELRKEGIWLELEIYSSYTPNRHILRKLTIPNVMQFRGSVFGDVLKQVKKEADILIHVEAFEKKYRQLTYTAMSTKISEYLSVGQTILAIGPAEAASIEFLKQNKVALVVTDFSKSAIKEQIRDYIINPKKYQDMSDRAVWLAKEKFSKDKNAKEIYEIISGTL